MRFKNGNKNDSTIQWRTPQPEGTNALETPQLCNLVDYVTNPPAITTCGLALVDGATSLKSSIIPGVPASCQRLLGMNIHHKYYAEQESEH
jgi:hypothetical protein